MDEDYNSEWCADRHGKIDKALDRHDRRISKVENRFIVMLTLLIMNLAGIIAVLLK